MYVLGLKLTQMSSGEKIIFHFVFSLFVPSFLKVETISFWNETSTIQGL